MSSSLPLSLVSTRSYLHSDTRPSGDLAFYSDTHTQTTQSARGNLREVNIGTWGEVIMRNCVLPFQYFSLSSTQNILHSNLGFSMIIRVEGGIVSLRGLRKPLHLEYKSIFGYSQCIGFGSICTENDF